MAEHDVAELLCSACFEAVDPSDPDVVYAVEQQNVTPWGSESTVWADGDGHWFHSDHLDGFPNFREVAKPDDPGAGAQVG